MPFPLLGTGLALATEFAPSLIRMFAGEKAGAVADQVVGAAKLAKAREQDIGRGRDGGARKPVGRPADGQRAHPWRTQGAVWPPSLPKA